jgi:hypothetical protein
MSKPNLSLLSKMTLQKKIILLLITTSVFSILFSFYSLYKTKQAIALISNQEFTKASQIANQASYFPKIISIVSFRKSDTIESWKLALEIIQSTPQLETIINDIKQNVFSPQKDQKNFTNLESELRNIQKKLNTMMNHLDSSLLLSSLRIKPKLSKALELNTQAITILETINQEPHTLLLLLQNTDELRASGGFMGSYARIDFDNGSISNIRIQDIYEPDGQFQGFVDAPPGAKKYLSGGGGLRLPDSNWHPDFPTAAKIISNYFAFGDERKIDSIATVNVDLIEKILKITGEIYLPDYGLTVTSDNLTALARADRNAFFAGSKQKTNFLSGLFDHLKIKLSQLDQNQQFQLAQLFLISLENKEIQLFSWHQPLQNIFADYNYAGEIEFRNQADFYLYLIESNVGINKANKKIKREVKLNLGQNRTDLEINYHNDGSESLLDYVNYQRVIIDPMSSIKEIKYDNQLVNFYEDLITNSEGQVFKQVGFLLPLESNRSKTLIITFNHQTICTENLCKLQLQKQSGLQATPYTINFKGETRNIILEKDEIISFE